MNANHESVTITLRNGRTCDVFLYPEDNNGFFKRVYHDNGEILLSKNAGKICDESWSWDNDHDVIRTVPEEIPPKKTYNIVPRGMIPRLDKNDRPYYPEKYGDGYRKIYLDKEEWEEYPDMKFVGEDCFLEDKDYYAYNVIKEKLPKPVKAELDIKKLKVRDLYPKMLGYEEKKSWDYELVKNTGDKYVVDLDVVVNMAQEMYILYIDETWYKFNPDTQIYDEVSSDNIRTELTYILRNTPNAPFPLNQNFGNNMMYMVWTNATETGLMKKLTEKSPSIYEFIQKEYIGNIIRFKNCIFNYDTGKILPYTPYFFTKSKYNGTFDPTIHQHPVEKIYRNIIPDEDSYNFFFEAVGYTMFDDEMNLPMIFLIYGPGETGKSALVEAVRTAMGSNNVGNLNLNQLSSEFGPVDLLGKNLNLCSETGGGAIRNLLGGGPNGELLKQLTDGSPLTFQRKFKSSITKKNTAKLWFVSNTLPNFGDTSSGIYRRLYILPCRVTQKWSDRIYDKMQTPDAISWMINEALKGYKRFLDRGEQFMQSEEMIKEHLQYRRQDSFTDFLADTYNVQNYEEIRDVLDGRVASEIYDEYIEFAKVSNARPFARKNLVEKIRNEYRMDYVPSNYYRGDGSRTSGMTFKKVI